jgi:hypothetical protein
MAEEKHCFILKTWSHLFSAVAAPQMTTIKFGAVEWELTITAKKTTINAHTAV